MKSVVGSFGPWQQKRQLGLGGFGEVYLWQNIATGQQIATKSLKENPNLSKDEIDKLRQRWEQESKWMVQLQTPYIVRGLNDQIDQHFIAYLIEQHAWRPLQPIVMEYCNSGDLRAQLQLVHNINGLVEYEVREVLHALRHAIEFLHTKCRIEHRDLKPDNVVIHHADGRRFYKLTDFGFARSITENTMLKSIVGTRNYVAPEVLDTAEYKNTVDYWSTGIIAYELICGNLPFIPQHQLFDIVTNIRRKPQECIAITEEYPEKKFIFQTHIPVENRMSKVFLNSIEKWLTIALDQNYHTRGTRPSSQKSNERILTFYTEIDAILKQKILSVFCLSTLTLYTWQISTEMMLLEFRELVRRDTGIQDVFCIFPSGHPRPMLSATYKPIDFYVEEWAHNRDGNSPPVMLYITGSSDEYIEPQPQIPPCIKKCLSTKTELPTWVLEALEQSTHYLLSNEQFYIQAFIKGLKEYALTMEHDILQYDIANNDNMLQQYFDALTDMNGRIDQFCMNIDAAKQACESRCGIKECFDDWQRKSEKLNNYFLTIQSLKTKVNRYYKSGLRRAKEMALNPILDELSKKDVYKLIEFRRHLENVQKKGKISYEQRLETCRTAVYECLEQRRKLMSSEHLKYAYSTITSVQKEFQIVKGIVYKSIQQLIELRGTLAQSTIDLHKQICDIYNGTKTQRNNLLQDGASSMLANGHDNNSIHELFQYPMDPLIEEVHNLMTKMDIDEDMWKNDDLPTTIEP
ncbi:inhibitor of nuclear factor kappa-B kinase subunit beta [Eurosta solidaginis]|uniref:inhibitor of nuclear factor kappa-B kinase subunit beta n=1 Tax=Eurosta solidaginis TaxID=178769 RepID=UPI003530C94C